MNKIRFGAIFLVFVATGIAQERECRIGTSLAVNPNRPLVSGEEIARSPGTAMLVEIDQLQSRGSTKIVGVLCLLPAGTEIVVGGPFPWVKKCGNNFRPQGWALPPATSQLAPPSKPLEEPQKQIVVVEKQVERKDGDVNVNVKVDVHNTIPPQPRCLTCDKPPKKSWIRRYWPVVAVAGGAAVLGGYLGARGGNGGKSTPTKNAVTVVRLGP